MLVVRATVIWLPLGDRAPVQPFEPIQAVALTELQVRVVVPPLAIVVAAALIDAVGGACATFWSPPQAASSSIAIGKPRPKNLERSIDADESRQQPGKFSIPKA